MLTALQETAFSTWLTQSETIWGYPTVLTMHTFAMMVLVGIALVVDLRLLGFGRDIPLAAMDRLFGVLWSAFAISAATGAMLFATAADTRGRQMLFWGKIALVLVGLAITVVIRRRHVLGTVEPGGVPAAGRQLALLSVITWVAAMTAGRFLAYFV